MSCDTRTRMEKENQRVGGINYRTRMLKVSNIAPPNPAVGSRRTLAYEESDRISHMVKR